MQEHKKAAELEVSAAIETVVRDHPEHFPEGVPDPIITEEGWDLRIRAPWVEGDDPSRSE